MQSIQKQLQDACFDQGEASFRNDYSGRGMYGRRCVGITGTMEHCMMVIGMVIKNMREDLKQVQMGSSEHEQDQLFEEAVDTLLDFKQDSMGYDVILYWPELASIEEEEESDGQPDEAQEWHDFDPDC